MHLAWPEVPRRDDRGIHLLQSQEHACLARWRARFDDYRKGPPPSCDLPRESAETISSASLRMQSAYPTQANQKRGGRVSVPHPNSETLFFGCQTHAPAESDYDSAEDYCEACVGW